MTQDEVDRKVRRLFDKMHTQLNSMTSTNCKTNGCDNKAKSGVPCMGCLVMELENLLDNRELAGRYRFLIEQRLVVEGEIIKDAEIKALKEEVNIR